MPYRLNPKDKTEVQVYKDGQWKTAPGGKHENSDEARKHLRALLANVQHAWGKKKE